MSSYFMDDDRPWENENKSKYNKQKEDARCLRPPPLKILECTYECDVQ